MPAARPDLQHKAYKAVAHPGKGINDNWPHRRARTAAVLAVQMASMDLSACKGGHNIQAVSPKPCAPGR